MKTNKLKACIFDLDGVIVDTAKYHYQAWKNIANELGFEFTETHNERLKGVSRMRSLDILLEVGGIHHLTQEQKEDLAFRKNEEYKGLINQMTPDEILPGVVEFLTSLRHEGFSIALGSASKNTPTILNRVQLTSYFDVVVDGNSVSTAKPDPEVFLTGAQKLGVEAKYCCVFEDAQAGIEAANRAGMFCIGVGSPLVLNGAYAYIDGFSNFNIDKLLQICTVSH
jgi:beta-phosphoglucomutase